MEQKGHVWDLGLGASVIALAVVSGWALSAIARGAPGLFNFALFAVAASVVIGGGFYVAHRLSRLSQVREDLRDRGLYYSALVETVSDGFAVCEAVRDEKGKLVDYVVVEMNPALQRMLGVGSEALGRRLTETPGDWEQWLHFCDQVLKTGRPQGFERFNRATGLWHEVHVSRVSENRMAQFFFDITARKAAEARQADLFAELNHRVMNNLSLVAGLLHLQARGAQREARDQLAKAAARVNSIAEVHGALSRGEKADRIDFATYLEDLCAGFAAALGAEDRIEIAVAAEPAMLSIKMAVPLGMIVNELVTNSVKYAYPEPEHGRIDVTFRPGAKGYLLTVRDHGKGFNEAPAAGSGLGMKLVRSLVRQAGGKFRVRNVQGTLSEITLPAEAIATPSPGLGNLEA